MISRLFETPRVLRRGRFAVLLVLLFLALAGTGLRAQSKSKQAAATSAEQAARVQAARRNPLPTESMGQLDGNPILFAVLAAINGAGYDTEIDSPSNHPLRKAVREYLAKQNAPILPALRRFVRDHKGATEEADLGQYISFALLSKGPPDFTPAQANLQQPKDADGLKEFAPLVAAYYREANIAALWQQVQPAYDEALQRYTEPVSRAVTQVDALLRVQKVAGSNAQFHAFVDLLGAPNQVQTRIYIDQYYVVVTPSLEPRINEIRHHYMHFQSDSLGFKYAGELQRIRPLGDFGLASPLLDAQYREDFLLLATECFIKAAEARILHEPAAVEQAKREGFVLAPAFFDLLPKYEAQPDPMRLYFGDMVKAINVRDEARRLDKIDFATVRSERTVRVTVEVKPPMLKGVAKMLDDAEEFLRKQDAPHAKEILTLVAGGTPLTQEDKVMFARAFYGLARVALLERNPEVADGLFRKVLDMEPDVATEAWSLLYLGKLADSQGEDGPAKEFYTQALAVAGIPNQVKLEAEQGKAGAFFKARKQEQ